MKNPLFTVITQAIDERRLLGVVDEAGPRVIEPHLVFESKAGDMVLHGWLRRGAYRSQPPPRWCNLHLNDLKSAEILEEGFEQPRPDYNPEGPHFHRIIYALDEVGHRKPGRQSAALSTHSRVKRERRGPPPRRDGQNLARRRSGQA